MGFTGLAESDLALEGLGLGGGVFGLAGSALGQVGLVALALGVSQVVPFVVVQRQTQLAFIAANKQTNKQTIKQIDCKLRVRERCV